MKGDGIPSLLCLRKDSVSFLSEFHEVWCPDGIGLGCREWVKRMTSNKNFPEEWVLTQSLVKVFKEFSALAFKIVVVAAVVVVHHLDL